MIRTFMKRALSTVMSFLLVFPVVPLDAAGQEPAPTAPTEYAGQGAPLISG